jgi:YYY domain-containing protein
MDMTHETSAVARGVRFAGTLWGQNALLIAALAITLGLALGLRFYGLDWDRGHSFTPHPDERAILMKVGELSAPSIGELDSLFDADRSPLNPRWFPYGSFPLYLLKGANGLYSLFTGAELHDLRILGRTISALADVATMVVVYLLGVRMFGRREGLLASALLALAVLHIQLSHFFAVDTIMAMCAAAALYFLYGVAAEGRLRDSVLAGVFIGLGVATKVSLAPIFVAFIMAHLMYAVGAIESRSGTRRDVTQRLSAAGAGAFIGAWTSLLVFAVVQPYAFLDLSRFYADTIEQSEMVRRIRDYPYTRQYVDTTAYLYQVRQLATWGLGWPLGIVAWAGLLYASLRGMRVLHGLVYIAAGWGLPVAMLLFSNSVLAIFAASGVAFVALVGTLPFRSQRSRGAVLLLSWVVPYFLIIGSFQVKFIRYLIPITPFLLLFGSTMLFGLWDRVKERAPGLRGVLVAGLFLLLGSTAFYAISYMAIYSESHTAVRTSRWINANAPLGSVILKEHWEEGIPNLRGYVIKELPIYDDDGERKLQSLTDELEGADYIVFYSNRLYGTIPRLPERYPVSSEYYRLLFTGELGYELVNVESSYARLAGVSFVEETFDRPGLPEPDLVKLSGGGGLELNLGFADESFTVYDHPLGLVFQNVERYPAETLRFVIERALAGRPARASDSERKIGLLLSPEDLEAQRRGGTWTEIVRPDSWTARHPVLSWLLLVEGLAILALPMTFALFRPLADRGYLFSKIAGILAVALAAWLLASLHWVAFSREGIAIAMLLLTAVSVAVARAQYGAIADFVRRRWRTMLVGEAVFLAAFLGFVLVRMANPDLWHPHLGGEKPMDLAYLNAVLKSSYMPPYDPWFGGGYLNYYYWGQFIVAMFVKATGIDPAVAFNLAVPLFFSLTVAGAFSIVYNLAEGTRRSIEGLAAGPRVSGFARWAGSPVMAGLAGAAFVTLIGNLDGAVQVAGGVWRSWIRDLPFGEFDFWRSTRVMPPDPPGHEVTEFPFFTFLFGDLHAHLMAIPFTLLVLGLALALVLGAARAAVGQRRPVPRRGWGPAELARLAALGVAVGALRLINTWDYPTYLIVAGMAVFLAAYLRNGGLNLAVLAETGRNSMLVFLVGYLAFLPYNLSYETFFTHLEGTTNQTVLWQFLLINGLFVFIIGTFFIIESRGWLLPLWRGLRARIESGIIAAPDGDVGSGASGSGGRVDPLRALALAVVAALGGYVAATVVSALAGSTIPVIAVLLGLVLFGALSRMRSFAPDAPHVAFAAAIAGVSLMLVIGLDVFRVEGDIDRMNSVFKFYLQVWVMLGIASAYLLWRLAYTRSRRAAGPGRWRKTWAVALVALVAAASIYPLLGTRDRLGERFGVLPMTLDGTAYMRETVYQDRRGDIDLAADYEGISWLQQNVAGSPLILEGLTPNYRWGGRISVYTGLPTIIGWQWHQEQQRWGYRWAVGDRARDVDQIYRTTSPSEALSLMRMYGVEYVYIGQLERLYYPEDGLGKFGEEMDLEEVYRNDQVRIYRVKDQQGESPIAVAQ